MPELNNNFKDCYIQINAESHNLSPPPNLKFKMKGVKNEYCITAREFITLSRSIHVYCNDSYPSLPRPTSTR